MTRFANEWKYFIEGEWCDKVSVREFIQKNYTPYIGGEEFLCSPTERTERLKAALEEKLREETEAKDAKAAEIVGL